MLDKLSHLPPREQVGLSIACAAILLLSADHFVVKPIFAELKRMDVSIEEKETKVAGNLKTLRYKESIETQYEQVKNLIGISSSDQDPIEFKGLIDDMAPQSGISVKSRKLMPPTTTDFLITYALQIGGFESEMAALINFLHEIQDTPGLLRVERLVLTSVEYNNFVKGSLTISKAMTQADSQE